MLNDEKEQETQHSHQEDGHKTAFLKTKKRRMRGSHIFNP